MAATNGNEAMVERMRKLVTDDPGMIGQVLRPQPVFVPDAPPKGGCGSQKQVESLTTTVPACSRSM